MTKKISHERMAKILGFLPDWKMTEKQARRALDFAIKTKVIKVNKDETKKEE